MAEPDTAEKSIRFGCGALFGGLLGLGVGLRAARHYETYVLPVGVAIGAALLLGWLAMKHGDSFWESFSR